MSHEQESTDKRLTGSSTGPLGPWLYTQIRSLHKLISSAPLQPEEHQSRVDTDCSLWHHIYSVVSTPGIWKHVLHCRLLTFMTSYASTHCMVRCNKKKLNCSKENWNFSHRKAKSYQQLNAIPRRCHAGLLKPLSCFFSGKLSRWPTVSELQCTVSCPGFLYFSITTFLCQTLSVHLSVHLDSAIYGVIQLDGPPSRPFQGEAMLEAVGLQESQAYWPSVSTDRQQYMLTGLAVRLAPFLHTH